MRRSQRHQEEGDGDANDQGSPRPTEGQPHEDCQSQQEKGHFASHSIAASAWFQL